MFDGLTVSAYPAAELVILAKHHVQISIVYRKEDALMSGLYDERIKKWQYCSFAAGLLSARNLSGKENKIE